MKFKLSRFGLLSVGCGMLYSSFQGIINFYRGYHNLDLAFNFLNLGYTQDFNTNGVLVSLKEYYLTGLNQMSFGFGWVCFGVILAFLFGYLIKKECGNYGFKRD